MYGKKEVRKIKCTIMNIDELKQRALQGDAEAQFELGKAYECGRDVVVNLWESVRMAMDIISDMIADAEEDEKPKRIGFFMQEDETANGNDIAAVAKK